MQPMNPYIVGNAVGGSPAFVGRDDILQLVYRILQNPGQNAILLHGQRRIGKTSILRQLETKLPEEGNYCPIFIDLLGKAHQSVEQLVQELAGQISDKLGKEKPQLGDDPKTYFHKTWLPNLLNTTEAPTLVLLFDEFDALDDDLAKQTRAEFFRYLHDLLSVHREKLDFVFAIGRNVSDLTQIALALFKGIPTKPVSLLNREDTLKLIRLSKDNNTLQWSTKAEEKVWQLTQGHPFLTQQICFCVWEHLYGQGVAKIPSVSPKHIDAIIPMVLERSESMLEWLWGGLESAQKVFISAVAEAGNKIVTKDELNASLSKIGIKISVPALENAPQSLEPNGWDLIKKERNGYGVKVELLRLLVAKYKPLALVKDELNRLEPEANRYYESAVKLRTEKKLEEALEELSHVLRLNPNHIDTVKLQANILLEQGKLTEALKKMENLFDDHPDEARPLLVQTLWSMAQSSEKEGEQLGFYEEILKFDNNHTDAKKEIQKIWKRRAERALRDGDCKSAVNAYQQAGLKDKVRETKKKCFWNSKPLKILGAIVVLVLVLFISYSVQEFWSKLLGIPWWLWGPVVGGVLAFLILIQLNRKPPENF
jgi:hypothetical protein